MSDPLTAVNEIQVLLGYIFRNPPLLFEALKTAGTGFDLRQPDGNKRLAQLGSSALTLAVHDDWYQSGAVRGESSAHMCFSYPS